MSYPSVLFESLPLSERQIEDGNEARPEHRNEVGAVQAEVAQIAMPALPVPIYCNTIDKRARYGAY